MLNLNKKYSSVLVSPREISKMISFSIPAILLITLYFAFRMEITSYWNQLYKDSALAINSASQQYPDYYWNVDLKRYKAIWIINYSLLFFSVLSIVNFRKFRNKQFGMINIGFTTLAIAAFLFQGLYVLGELRDSYLEQTLSQYYQRDLFNIGIRYISFAFVAFALVSLYQYIRQDFMQKDLKIAFDILLYTTILWIASSELIHWLNIAESKQSYKLGLSILWGIYSLLLIVLGIWKKNKPLRIGAIALFGFTLFKLFIYDISHLDTISKTIVFVSLGVLLLIISFLYNKFRHFIADFES
jgi:uncharacterized membrane protein